MRAQPAPPDGSILSLQMTIDGAYKHTLLPYHGWVTQKAFGVAVAAAPEWDDIRAAFAPDVHSFREDVSSFVSASQSLQRRVNAALSQLDLVDTRTTV